MKIIDVNDILNHKIKKNKDYSNGGFYLIENKITKKYYIGKSINYLSRLKSHLFKSSNTLLIDKELNTYSLDCFNFYLLLSYKELDINFFNRKLETITENKLIREYKTYIPYGYNIKYYGHF